MTSFNFFLFLTCGLEKRITFSYFQKVAIILNSSSTILKFNEIPYVADNIILKLQNILKSDGRLIKMWSSKVFFPDFILELQIN